MCKPSNNISFLLGAGFSASAGYPIGNYVNESVLNLFEQNIHFTPNGRLVHNYDPGFVTELGGYYSLFLSTIDYYLQTYLLPFNYEEFFDFLEQEILANKKYAKWWEIKNPHTKIDYDTKDKFLNIYNQIIEDIIYPNKNSKLEDYNEFIKWIVKRSKEKIVHIHTLNHDLLLEGELLPDFISDGYQLEGS